MSGSKDAPADVSEEHQNSKENGTCTQRCLLLTEHHFTSQGVGRLAHL
jgi:hypothetical protein